MTKNAAWRFLRTRLSLPAICSGPSSEDRPRRGLAKTIAGWAAVGHSYSATFHQVEFRNAAQIRHRRSRLPHAPAAGGAQPPPRHLDRPPAQGDRLAEIDGGAVDEIAMRDGLCRQRPAAG